MTPAPPSPFDRLPSPARAPLLGALALAVLGSACRGGPDPASGAPVAGPASGPYDLGPLERATAPRRDADGAVSEPPPASAARAVTDPGSARDESTSGQPEIPRRVAEELARSARLAQSLGEPTPRRARPRPEPVAPEPTAEAGVVASPVRPAAPPEAVASADATPRARPVPERAADPSAAREAAGPPRPELRAAASLYVEAQILERQALYREAVGVYDELLAGRPDYADARTRRDTLVEFVRIADAYYVRAMDSSSTSERRRYLAEIQRFWPGYRDVDELLGTLPPAKPRTGNADS